MGQAVDDARVATRGGPDDLALVDRELLGAGIHPGHPSLYPREHDAAGPGGGATP
jgi:hypothetical protein